LARQPGSRDGDLSRQPRALGARRAAAQRGPLMRAHRAARVAFLGLVLACAAAAQPLRSGLSTTRVTVRGVELTVEVARTPAEQLRGLGGRTWIDPKGGMLFPFGGPRLTAFVMRDCPIAIDVAFLDAE